MAVARLTPSEVENMRRVGRLAADTLVMVSHNIRPGLTTQDIDDLVHAHTIEHGARPAPLNYKGFPKSVCTSVNDVVCHGIPSGRVLEDGDIVNVDVTPVLPARNGFHGDTNATFYVGTPSAEARQVVEVARRSLELGIEQVRPGARLGDIGAAIQEYAESEGCAVVRDYCGHGIGRLFHTEPSVPHYGTRGTGLRLRRGMCFTIEPMINLGGFEIKHLDDGWTVLTRDGGLSAQFEHTILVSKRGCEVLTRRSEPLANSEDKPWSLLGPMSCFVPQAAR